MIVVKIGGSAGLNLDACCDDLARLALFLAGELLLLDLGAGRGVDEAVAVHADRRGGDPRVAALLRVGVAVEAR